jgi:hypothetical protein
VEVYSWERENSSDFAVLFSDKFKRRGTILKIEGLN